MCFFVPAITLIEIRGKPLGNQRFASTTAPISKSNHTLLAPNGGYTSARRGQAYLKKQPRGFRSIGVSITMLTCRNFSWCLSHNSIIICNSELYRTEKKIFFLQRIPWINFILFHVVFTLIVDQIVIYTRGLRVGCFNFSKNLTACSLWEDQFTYATWTIERTAPRRPGAPKYFISFSLVSVYL